MSLQLIYSSNKMAILAKQLINFIQDPSPLSITVVLVGALLLLNSFLFYDGAKKIVSFYRLPAPWTEWTSCIVPLLKNLSFLLHEVINIYKIWRCAQIQLLPV